MPQEIIDFYTKISNGAVLYPNDCCNLEPFENWYFDEKLIQTDFDIENDVTYDDYCAIKNKNNGYFFEDFGNIALMDLGCAMTYNIVVKGNHYGEIIGEYEMYLEITNKNFLDWFEGCLDGIDEMMI